MKAKLWIGTALAAVSLGLTACTHESPNAIYMPDMVYSPALKAQEEGAQRLPPKGTIPRGYHALRFAREDDEGGKELTNPLPRTHVNLRRGQEVFNIYCIVCHGAYGEGDGTVVPRFPRPPSLQSDKIRAWSDGQIVHIISKGRNLMPSYSTQIAPQDRWAVAHYLRALHRAKHPTPEDLKAAGLTH